MKTFTSALFVLLLLVLTLPASQAQTIRRVNNVGVTGAGIFTTLQAAHDAAVSGDIIYLEPSGISYGDLNCVKPLTIIGNGYFHGEQATPLVVDPRQSIVGIVNLFAGSQGSRVTGLTITNRIMINANNCTVERNFIEGNGCNIGRDDFQTAANAVITSGVIRQNFINAEMTLRPSSAGTTIAGVIIANNIIIGNIGGGNSTNVNSVLISNNVVGNRIGNSGGTIDVDNCVLKNNIVTRAGATFALRANATSNNVGTGTQFGTANGNQQNVTLAAIFTGTGTDAQFQITTGGPADNTGESGVDCGAFGATAPYVIAGIANVPTIFQYSQAVSGATLNATISTKSNR